VDSNRAVVDELIQLMNQRERRPTHLCHPDIEWHWPAVTPGKSVFRGHAELNEGLDTWTESWEELVIEPLEVLEDGDYILMILEYRMRGAGSGVYLEEPVAHLHYLENGLLRRWWMFGDAEKAKRRFLAGDRPAEG
jgi:ketosteroid isomerase-like protein